MIFTKIKLNKIAISALVFSFFVLLPLISFAQGSLSAPCIISGQVCNPINADTINGFIKQVLEGVLTIGIPIVALAIIYSGFLFVSARGKPEELKKAKDALLYTLIGAAILLGSWAIAQLISDTVLAL